MKIEGKKLPKTNKKNTNIGCNVLAIVLRFGVSLGTIHASTEIFTSTLNSFNFKKHFLFAGSWYDARDAQLHRIEKKIETKWIFCSMSNTFVGNFRHYIHVSRCSSLHRFCIRCVLMCSENKIKQRMKHRQKKRHREGNWWKWNAKWNKCNQINDVKLLDKTKCAKKNGKKCKE